MEMFKKKENEKYWNNNGIRKYLAQKGKQKKVDALQNNTQFFFKKIDLLQRLNLQVIN